MSKIEENKLTISHEPLNLERLFIDVCNVISVKSDEKKQVLRVVIDPEATMCLMGDELRLNQVLINLLSNAIKFTPDEGTIQLSVHQITSTDKTATLEFTVTDNGIGISEENQKKLFTSFEQADGGIARRFGGSGLGLSICKSIVELMGGEIWVESELGRGSKFIFTLTLDKAENQEPSGVVREIYAQNLRVLVVDDSEDTREYFQQIMGGFNIKTEVAESGQAALEKMSAAEQNGSPYDIVFIDLKMPGMDGVETAENIRNRFGDDVSLILISVAEWSEVEAEAKRAGIARFVPKPLFPSRLLDAINCTMGGVVCSDNGKGKNMIRADLSNYCVLLVEDVEINQEIIISLMEDTGLRFDIAGNGKEATEMFAANPQKYDLILMDIQMPVMDGLEATRVLRAMNIDKAKTIPILAMTANVFKEDIEKCRLAGIDDHLGKPVDERILREKVTQYLWRTEGKKADMEASMLNNNQTAQMPSSQLLDTGTLAPYVMVDEAMTRLRGNKKLYVKLLGSYQNGSAFEDIRLDMENMDLDKAKSSSHTLKGVVANLSLQRMYDRVVLLERAILNGQPHDEIREAFELVREAKLETDEHIAVLVGAWSGGEGVG